MLKFLKNIFSKKDKNKNFYEILGGQSGIQELVDHFYQTMENDPQAKECLAVHQLENGKVPKNINEKLVFFLTGWLGGPQLFIEKYGHPRMRKRHIHIQITPEHAGQWLYCMDKSFQLHPKKIKKEDKEELMNSFKALTLRIINS